jgi:probable biosynthetic protein (TIGR04098 family)
VTYEYDLVLGHPHTNYAGLSEHLLLAHAGHFEWASIGRAIGRPLSTLRTLAGDEVYATFFYIEERFPDNRPITVFRLDDHLRFLVTLRAFKNLSVEGLLVFDVASRLDGTSGDGTASDGRNARAGDAHPWIRFCNIFITPEGGNGSLRVAPPADTDFSALPVFPLQESPYHLTKAAEQTGELGLLADGWIAVDRDGPLDVPYAIEPDRDTNGVGLVYFANYVAFMNAAERRALSCNAARPLAPADVAGRGLVHRRVAFYGNVEVDDVIHTQVSLFARSGNDRVIGVRYAIRRERDNRLICRSEAIKVLPGGAA